MKPLVIGDPYSKSYFGITNYLPALHIVEGECCLFLTKNNKHNLRNSKVPGGLVYEAKYPCEVVKKDPVPAAFHVFFRNKPVDKYEYLGKSTSIQRHSPTQNLLVF